MSYLDYGDLTPMIVPEVFEPNNKKEEKLKMNTPTVTVGLYRHFKGAYYYVTGLSKNALDDSIVVNYFNVCHPEYGSFVRPLECFIATQEDDGRLVKDRKDNTTGQIARFERVKDLNFQLGSVSTEQLITELRGRVDSPIHELDIEGLQSNVFSKDYVVGQGCEATEDTPKGVYTTAVFDTPEQAQHHLATHSHRKTVEIFKRTFIKM